MSTHEDKVIAAYDFLANRASTRKLTNHTEVGLVIGKTLMEREQRRIDTPVRRDKIVRVLADVDQRSLEEYGVRLSAIVTHFWDALPGHRFWEAVQRDGSYDGGDRNTFATDYQARVFNAFPEYVGKHGLPKPEVEDYDDSEDYDTDEVDDELQSLVKAHRALGERLESYVGRHRANG